MVDSHGGAETVYIAYYRGSGKFANFRRKRGRSLLSRVYKYYVYKNS